MKNKRIVKYLIIAISIVIFTITSGRSYAKFILTRQLETTFSSYPFYFEATVTKDSFDYSESGITIPINIVNYVDNFYNAFTTEYEITLGDNTKFQLSNAVKGTIEGNDKKTNEESIKINSIEGADIGSSETINIVVKSTEPYSKEITIPITIKKSGELYAFMRSQYIEDDKDFNFHETTFVRNGVFMNYETREKAYPVYYYRGDVKNSIIYADHCWQIVRTTETGGLKLVYDGEVENGKCTTGRARLGSESYNIKPNDLASPSQVGYMYGEIENIITVSPSRVNDMKGNPDAIQDVTNLINEKLETEEKIIAGENIVWDGNSYRIEKYKEYSTANDITTARLLFKSAIEDNGDNNRYTCISSSDTCEKVYYLYKRDSEDVQAVILEDGETDYKAAITLVKDITNLIDNQINTGQGIIVGESISLEGGSYKINNYKTYAINDNTTTARMLFKNAIEDYDDNNHYTCISSSDTCDTVYYLYKRKSSNYVYAVILKNGETNYESIIAGQKVKIGTVFGNDVTYNDTTKQYTLQNTIEVNDLDELEDDIRGGTSGNYSSANPNAFHYTCLTSNSTCEHVYYIYYNNYGDIADDPASDGGLFGIKMEDGKNVTETLHTLLDGSTNNNNSHVKEYIDTWFQGQGSDFKGGEALSEHLDELEDAVFCNDRTVAGYHGWDKDADNHDSHNKYLHFDAFKRIVGEGEILPSRPRLSCDIQNDAFTVHNQAGNQKLTYPIALLDADEAVLAGAIFDKSTNTYLKSEKETFLMSPYYISDDHIRMFAIDVNGSLDDVYASNSYGIRPAIVLKDIFKISGGDGSKENPYTLQKS